MLVLSNNLENIFYKESRNSKVLNFISFNYRLHQNNMMYLNDKFNFVDFNRADINKQLTYLANNRVESDNNFYSDKRQSGKIGSVLKSMINPQFSSLFTNQDFEIAVNIIKSYLGELKLEVVSGQDIQKTYTEMPFIESGSLGSSCMRYSGCSDYFGIYTDNDCCSLIRLVDNKGVIYGRALLWVADCGTKIMDRIYTAEDSDIETFKRWARENEYIYKEYQSYDEKDSFVNPDGSTFNKSFTISLNTDFDYYPYIDTFTYGGDGYITNIGSCDEYTYNETDGSRDVVKYVTCEYSNNRIHEDDATWVEGQYEGYVDDEFVVSISSTSYCIHDDNVVRAEDDNWILTDNSDYIEIEGGYYPIEDCSYSEEEDEWFLHDDDERFIFSTYEDDHILKSNAVEIDGEWYKEDSSIVGVDKEGNYILIEE